MDAENRYSESETRFEELISGLLENSFGVATNFFPKLMISKLQNNLLSHLKDGNMCPAGVGKQFSFQRNTAIRGDLIRWIDTDTTDNIEREFLTTVQSFIQYLNRTCYTNINNYEFHYAYYDTGSFYKRHLDQFHKDSGRKFSFVTYLNTDWKPEDKGQLTAYTPEKAIQILPQGGTVAFFKANEVEHEVLPANRPRMSIAGWLKNG